MSHLDPIMKHKQDVRRYILLPLAASMGLITAIVIAIGVLTAMGTLTPRQVSTIASVLAIVCVLIPLGLIVVLVAFGIIVVAYGSGKLPQWTAALLRPVRTLIQSANTILQRVADVATEPIIFVERQLARIAAFVDGLLHFFSDTPVDPSPDEDQ